MRERIKKTRQKRRKVTKLYTKISQSFALIDWPLNVNKFNDFVIVVGLLGKVKSMTSSRGKSGKKENEEEPVLRATGRAQKSKMTSLYIDNVRSRSREKDAGTRAVARRSFNKSNFKADKDEIKKAYYDVRSDKTGIFLK